jgi:hypothetical protein
MAAVRCMTLWDVIHPRIESAGNRISYAGVRYGSVIYLAFGSPRRDRIVRRIVDIYPVEIELGADEWQLTRRGELVMDSDFEDVRKARSDLLDWLPGRMVTALVTENGTSRIEMDGGWLLSSQIAPDPASGFTYALAFDGGDGGESLDGLSLKRR